MGIVMAGTWGIAGGAAAGLVAWSADIVAAKYQRAQGSIWARLFVILVGIIVGALVAGAAHGQMTGPLPALLTGVSAPTIIRGAFSKVGVVQELPEAAPIRRQEEHAV